MVENLDRAAPARIETDIIASSSTQGRANPANSVDEELIAEGEEPCRDRAGVDVMT